MNIIKYILFACMVVVTNQAFTQTLTYEQVTHSDNPKNELLKKYEAYTASDGYTYKVGENLTVGMPSSNKTCAFLLSELMLATDEGPYGLDAKWSGNLMSIRSIKVDRNKKRGASVIMRCYLAGIGGVLVKFEQALASGEIVGLGITSDQALEKIKKAKNMLELELITQQEYDSIKVEYMPFIK